MIRNARASQHLTPSQSRESSFSSIGSLSLQVLAAFRVVGIPSTGMTPSARRWGRDTTVSGSEST
eukprot:1689270-Rhodomonas_salina.1